MAQPVPLGHAPTSLRPQAMILVGGLGTRLRELVADRSKPLALVHGRPFLSYLLDQLEWSGIRQVILCTGYLGEQVKEQFGSAYGSLSLKYSPEWIPLGTAGALHLALSQMEGEWCLAMNGDSYVDADLSSFMDWHRERRYEGSLLLTWEKDTARYGMVEVRPNGEITAFREKQLRSKAGWISAGVYFLSRRLIETIPANRPVSIERDIFPAWVGLGLGGYCTKSQFIDIGTPESYQLAEAFFAQRIVNRK